jgi:hypothetical protein
MKLSKVSTQEHWARLRKNFRLTQMCARRLVILSKFYNTSEAAIVEASVNGTYNLYLNEILREPGDFITPDDLREEIDFATWDHSQSLVHETTGGTT